MQNEASTQTEDESLGIITNTASRAKTEGLDGRTLLYVLQAAARDLLPGHRVGLCMRRVVPGQQSVDVVRAADAGRLKYKNLMRCSRLWVCPMCSSQIAEKRRALLSTCLERSKYETMMITYTIRHHAGQRCSEVVTTLTEAYRCFTGGRAYQGMMAKYGIVASIRALEVTHGDNGFHPHLHVLVLGKPGMKAQHEDAEFQFLLRWQSMVESLGGDANENGVKITTDGNIGVYVAKITGEDKPRAWGIAEELTKQPAKAGRRNGRSAKALLIDYVEGDSFAGAVWVEMVECLSGRKQLVPSRNFWALLGAQDVKDEIKAETTARNDEIFAQIDLQSWRVICQHEARAAVLARLEKGESLGEILLSFWQPEKSPAG